MNHFHPGIQKSEKEKEMVAQNGHRRLVITDIYLFRNNKCLFCLCGKCVFRCESIENQIPGGGGGQKVEKCIVYHQSL